MSQAKTVQMTPSNALAIVCGAGSLPFALADAAMRSGQRTVLFALRGWADRERVKDYPHHWVWMGQLGRFLRLAKTEGCRDVAFIGTVTRPSLWHIRPDVRVLLLMPQLFRLFRGGDDHLLSGIGRLFKQHGFRLVSPKDIAPEMMIREGVIGQRTPNERDRADIALGLRVLTATSPFDIGQAVIVAENQVLAVEGPEGTDQAIARVAELRRNGRIRSRMGTGVLVKASKVGQDPRFDLPTIGPQTVEGAALAGLAGIAALAGTTIIAEPQATSAAADRHKLFIFGIAPVSAVLSHE